MARPGDALERDALERRLFEAEAQLVSRPQTPMWEDADGGAEGNEAGAKKVPSLGSVEALDRGGAGG